MKQNARRLFEMVPLKLRHALDSFIYFLIVSFSLLTSFLPFRAVALHPRTVCFSHCSRSQPSHIYRMCTLPYRCLLQPARSCGSAHTRLPFSSHAGRDMQQAPAVPRVRLLGTHKTPFIKVNAPNSDGVTVNCGKISKCNICAAMQIALNILGVFPKLRVK